MNERRNGYDVDGIGTQFYGTRVTTAGERQLGAGLQRSGCRSGLVGLGVDDYCTLVFQVILWLIWILVSLFCCFGLGFLGMVSPFWDCLVLVWGFWVWFLCFGIVFFFFFFFRNLKSGIQVYKIDFRLCYHLKMMYMFH